MKIYENLEMNLMKRLNFLMMILNFILSLPFFYKSLGNMQVWVEQLAKSMKLLKIFWSGMILRSSFGYRLFCIWVMYGLVIKRVISLLSSTQMELKTLSTLLVVRFQYLQNNFSCIDYNIKEK